MNSLANQPVFPTPYFGAGVTAIGGLTLRQYYAGLAHQALLISDTTDGQSPEEIAEQAIENADALLAKLGKEGA